jgi:predicted amidohydrolase
VTIDSNGRILTTYAKIHPFSPAHEDAHYLAGNDVGIFSLAGVSFGIAICYDLRFPALFRIYALKGVHCVLVPAAWPAPRRHHWELLIRSRALDNRIYIAGINTTGTNPVDSYHGGSMAADPDGNVIMQAGEKEGTYVFSIDPENVLSQQASQVASDRRSTLYHQLLS